MTHNFKSYLSTLNKENKMAFKYAINTAKEALNMDAS